MEVRAMKGKGDDFYMKYTVVQNKEINKHTAKRNISYSIARNVLGSIRSLTFSMPKTILKEARADNNDREVVLKCQH